MRPNGQRASPRLHSLLTESDTTTPLSDQESPPHLAPHVQHPRLQYQRPRRGLFRVPSHRLSRSEETTQPRRNRRRCNSQRATSVTSSAGPHNDGNSKAVCTAPPMAALITVERGEAAPCLRGRFPHRSPRTRGVVPAPSSGRVPGLARGIRRAPALASAAWPSTAALASAPASSSSAHVVPLGFSISMKPRPPFHGVPGMACMVRRRT